MKHLSFCLMATILLISCGDEYSFEGQDENNFKKRHERKLKPNEGFGNGNNLNQVTTQQVPFDFGLSAVLGLGGLAAIRAAHKRRKQAATDATSI